MLAPASPLFGRIAEWDGRIAGFTRYAVLHEGSWTIRPCCYLEDLFLAPDLRGRGIARALIDDLLTALPPAGLVAPLFGIRAARTKKRDNSMIVSRQPTISSATAYLSTSPMTKGAGIRAGALRS